MENIGATINMLRELARSMPEGDGMKLELEGIVRGLKKDNAPKSISDALFDRLIGLSAPKNFAVFAEIRYYGDGGMIVGNAAQGRIRRAESEGIHRILRSGVEPTPCQMGKLVSIFVSLADQALQIDSRFMTSYSQMELPFWVEGVLDARAFYAKTVTELSHSLGKEQVVKTFAKLQENEKRWLIESWIEKALPSSEITLFFKKELDAMQGKRRDGRLEALRQRLDDMAKKPAHKEMKVRIPALNPRQTN